MIHSIAKRTRRVAPLSETEFKIIRSATKLFLENGFSHTTISMICSDSGIGRGNIVYYFHTKEDMLFLLLQELMDFHKTVIEETINKTGDVEFACAMEIATQIALCESNPTAYDLYYSAYSHQGIFDFIKEWSAKKNHELLGATLLGWTYEDFCRMENVASHVEFSALTTPCDEKFTLEDKISLVLDSYMKLFDVSKEKRDDIIGKVLKTDYKKVSEEIFNKFLEKFYNSIDEN